MAQKKAARRRAAAKRAKRAKRTRQPASLRLPDLAPPPIILGPSPEQDLEDLQEALWHQQTDPFEDQWARAYLAKHGECAICRARVGVVSRSVHHVEVELR